MPRLKSKPTKPKSLSMTKPTLKSAGFWFGFNTVDNDPIIKSISKSPAKSNRFGLPVKPSSV